MTTCSVCGANANWGRCPVCLSNTCAICGQPIYRDESRVYNAQGKAHQRCAYGTARPRPHEIDQEQVDPVALAQAL